MLDLSPCMTDYDRFQAMTSSELSSTQNQYYSELHQLQDELDELLHELLLSLHSFKASYKGKLAS